MHLLTSVMNICLPKTVVSRFDLKIGISHLARTVCGSLLEFVSCTRNILVGGLIVNIIMKNLHRISTIHLASSLRI